MIDMDPKEQVGKSTDVVTENMITPLLPTQVPSQVPSDEHPTTLRGNLEPHKLIPEPHEIIDCESCETEPISNIEIPSRYELPPRRTRGVSPKRYDLEFEAR